MLRMTGRNGLQSTGADTISFLISAIALAAWGFSAESGAVQYRGSGGLTMLDHAPPCRFKTIRVLLSVEDFYGS